MKDGDILYIESIDRLGRDYDGIINEWNSLEKEKNIILKVLDTPMLDRDNRTDNTLLTRYMRDMLLLSQAFQSEHEWHKIKNRQAQGIGVAKANGKILGRPKAGISEAKMQIAKEYMSKEITIEAALRVLGIKKSAFYNLCSFVRDIEKNLTRRRK